MACYRDFVLSGLRRGRRVSFLTFYIIYKQQVSLFCANNGFSAWRGRIDRVREIERDSKEKYQMNHGEEE